jgi:8-oxo-dGTP pyrophosphatase MutT (NUDIX family)
LRRELREEVGLEIRTDPPHVWHQEVVAAGHAVGYDGGVNDYFLVRTAAFDPRGALSDDELAAENISGLKWKRRCRTGRRETGGVACRRRPCADPEPA